MFLFEKYRPTKVSELMFNQNIMEELLHIASYDDIPHIIVSGPSGGGKKTLVNFFLEAVYDKDVHNLKKISYNVNGSSTKKEVEIMQSNYHIIIEPTNTNHDRYILQEITKQYAMYKPFNIFKTNRNFKTIVIYNVDNLAISSQAALRRTMEIYAKSCRFVMVCNNLSKLFEPLRSRCRIFCTPLPSEESIKKIISTMCLHENIDLNNKSIEYIIKNANDNLKKAIWLLDTKRLNSPSLITLDEAFETVVELILNSPKSKDVVRVFEIDIRSNIYNILITNIKGTDIITSLMDLIIKRIDDDEINSRIIQHASNAEYNLIHGRRDIINIDYFILGVMKELINREYDNQNSEEKKSKICKAREKKIDSIIKQNPNKFIKPTNSGSKKVK